jgi:CheY-like chemotaxis protein
MAYSILIIDDDLDMRVFLKTLTSTAGYRPTVCQDGEKGLAAARQSRPDCIILDVMMPGDGGAITYKALKQDENLKTVPVLMLSAVAPKAFLHYLKMLNANLETALPEPEAYLQKPPEASEVLETLARLAGDAKPGSGKGA